MKKFIDWLNNKFAPKMQVVNNNPWISTIKESIMQVLPLIFLGSIFCILAIPADFVSWWPNFWAPYGWTFGLVSIFIAFLIPFNLMEKKRKRKSRINAGIAGEILFLMALNPQFVAAQQECLGGDSIAFSELRNIGGFGAGGMFVAIVCALVAAVIVNALSNFTFFRNNSVIPDFVKNWFDSMLPIGLVTILGWVLTGSAYLNLNLYQIIVNLFMPLQNLIQSPYGFVLLMFLYCFLYSMGISTWVLVPVASPVFLAAAELNHKMLEAGTATAATLNLVTDATVYSAYLWIGGVGCTLPLVIQMLTMAKSKEMKALGKACIGPAILNINEPVVFGAVAWNPFLMVPMWINGIILPLVVYLFTKIIQLAPIPTDVFNAWYCPFPISTLLTTRSFLGLLLVVVVFIISWFIWMPFFKVYDNQLVAGESKQAQKGE